MNRNTARIILLTAGVIWGFGFVANKYIIDSGWDDSQLLFVRFFSATASIFLIFFKRIIKTDRDTLEKGLFLGIFLFLGFFFQTWGLEETTPSKNALITAGYIIVLPLIIYLFERKFVGYKSYIAGFLTFSGIVIISVDFQKWGSGLNIGDVLTFIGAIFWGIHLYLLGKTAKKKDPITLMAFQLLTVSILSYIAMMIKAGHPRADLNDWNSLKIFLSALAIGFFASFIGFVFQSIGQKYTHASEAAVLISTESVFGPIFSIIFYNELFSMKLVFGMAFVFMGILLSEIDVVQVFKNYKSKFISRS
ncbi:MAG: DMT family transporter [Candidatus Izemoplasmatales bacterium]